MSLHITTLVATPLPLQRGFNLRALPTTSPPRRPHPTQRPQ